MSENRIVLKGKRGSLEAKIPAPGGAGCERLAVRRIARGLFAFAKKADADVSCEISVRESGGFLLVSAHARAKIGEKCAKGTYTLVLKDGVPWEPSREEKKALSERAAKAAERALRLGEPLYGDAPVRAGKFFSRAQIVPEDGGLMIVYPPRTVADGAKSFFVKIE